MRKILSYGLEVMLLILTLSSCNGTEKETLSISKNSISFYSKANSDTINIVSNTQWEVEKVDNSDWYELSCTSGNKDGMLIVSVHDFESYSNRSGSFIIKTKAGKKEETVTIKQNGQNYTIITNTIWGVSFYERWNTDYYNEIIPETYQNFTFDVTDTLQGFTMYFLENNTGCQADHKTTGTNYYLFDYEYNETTSEFFIAFETTDENVPENYNAKVNTLNDTLFVFTNEYKDNWFEKATMKKLAEINSQRTQMTYPRAIKKQGQAIFDIESIDLK